MGSGLQGTRSVVLEGRFSVEAGGMGGRGGGTGGAEVGSGGGRGISSGQGHTAGKMMSGCPSGVWEGSVSFGTRGVIPVTAGRPYVHVPESGEWLESPDDA